MGVDELRAKIRSIDDELDRLEEKRGEYIRELQRLQWESITTLVST